jgi:hypothetical protein
VPLDNGKPHAGRRHVLLCPFVAEYWCANYLTNAIRGAAEQLAVPTHQRNYYGQRSSRTPNR